MSHEKPIKGSIGLRFLCIIASFVGVTSCILLCVFWVNSNAQTEKLLLERSGLALQFDLAIRDYISETVRPFAQEKCDEDVFIPEVMSTSFAARSIFEKVRGEFPDYVIKFSSDNPRNPKNLASPEELKIIEYFNQHPDEETWAGKINLQGQPHMGLFSARRMEADCLQCHGVPEDAPASLIARYGDQAGFYRPVGEVIALDALAIPVAAYRALALKQTAKTFLFMMVGLVSLITVVYCTYQRLVGRRLLMIASHFKQAEGHGKKIQLENCRSRTHDEIDVVIDSFNGMVDDLATYQNTLEEKVEERTETLRRVNESLKTANMAKSEFLANMSHEIRTPMNIIVGFGDVLTNGQLTEEQREGVNAIRESSLNLSRLIDDILDFSKIEAGQLKTEVIEICLGTLLNSLESMMKPTVRDKAFEFAVVAAHDLPAKIRTDPYRLKQCLINLLNNAIKFTQQGHVYLRVSLTQDKGQHFIQFDVEDTGIGIPKHRIQAIFESFTQVDGSTSRQFGGTGLGLTITRQLAGLLGGSVAVRSEPGQGSTFSLVIPTGLDVTQQPSLDRQWLVEQDPAPRQEKETAQFSGRVLVAEDVKGNQRLMELMLSALGVEVSLANDGQEAVGQAMSGPFDLILMDMQMPNLNGYEATKQLKAQGCGTPIVALTASAMTGDDQRCLDAGCDGYLMKPVDAHELARTLAKYLPSAKPVEEEKPSSAGQAVQACESDPQPQADRLIDWNTLVEAWGGEDVVRDLLPVYFKDIQSNYRELCRAVAQGDCSSIASWAHALKGVGRNLHVMPLYDIAGHTEKAGRNNDLQTCREHFNGLKSQIINVIAALAQLDCIQTLESVKTM